MTYDEWVFSELVRVGAIRDYSKNPPTGKGKPPKGSLSVQVVRIGELRQDPNVNQELWGLIGSTLLNNPPAPNLGTGLLNKFAVFATKANPDNPTALVSAMRKAVDGAWHQYKANYKENAVSEALG